MKKKGLLLFLLLVLAVLADITKEGLLKDGYVEREEMQGEEKMLQLQLEIEGIAKDYPYSLEVQPVVPSKSEAEECFAKTITQIESDFKEVGAHVLVQKDYQSGIVKADWSFRPYGLISSEGEIYSEKLEEEETIIDAQVTLSCGRYEQIYKFSFLLRKPKLSVQEQVLLQVKDKIQEEMDKEGSKQIQLPTEINGISLVWSEKKEYVTPKIILLEVLSVVLLWMASKRKEREQQKKRNEAMEREYPDIVSQLALLLGAGMTTRQAWERIASQYSFKKQAKMILEKPVYEAILRMNRQLVEGESERVVYQKFVEEISAPCYHKLVRILLGNLEKGTQGVANRLEEESRAAFEKRILHAKKLGEEASTKMMLPLMMMLMIVMGMIMVPALIGFHM